jgi:hypothetical protein
MPIAVLEHHQMVDPVLSAFDICDRLGLLWLEIRRQAESNSFMKSKGTRFFDASSIIRPFVFSDGIEAAPDQTRITGQVQY